MKNRSFSLTSHQLRALTQLASTMLGFERTVKELVTNLALTDCTGEAAGVKGAPSTPLPNKHMFMHVIMAVAICEITEVTFFTLSLTVGKCNDC